MKITYKFNDGTTQEIEVSDELYVAHLDLTKREKNDNRRETRRHTSLNYLNDLGVDFEENGADPLSILLAKEENRKLEKIFEKLKPAQRELLELFYIDRKKIKDIARDEGVSKQAISARLATVRKKLKTIFEKV